MINTKPDRQAFERVCEKLDGIGGHLTLNDIVDVFGLPAFELLMLQQPNITVTIKPTHSDLIFEVE